jgi:hypothetical protein
MLTESNPKKESSARAQQIDGFLDGKEVNDIERKTEL